MKDAGINEIESSAGKPACHLLHAEFRKIVLRSARRVLKPKHLEFLRDSMETSCEDAGRRYDPPLSPDEAIALYESIAEKLRKQTIDRGNK